MAFEIPMSSVTHSRSALRPLGAASAAPDADDYGLC